MSNIRTYKLKHSANQNKQDKVVCVLKEYRKVCHVISKKQWRNLFSGGQLSKMDNLDYVKSDLSERYKRNCAYQVDSSLQSFLSNLQNRFKDFVYHSSINEETRIVLFRINARKCWYVKEHELFSKEQLWLARKIFKRLLDTHRKPRLLHSNMLLNENVASVVADKTKSSKFDYWIKLSTLDKGEPIYIPVQSNDYFNNKEGVLKSAVQFNFSDANKFTVSLMKDVPVQKIAFRTEKIALDFGLKNLFTTSDGRMFGKDFYLVIQKYDALISTLSANRQRQKLKTKSARYNGLVSNLRSYIKNEINRVLNRIVFLYAPKEIVLERLNFHNAHLSKKLNRILQNCGRDAVNKKLESLTSISGIQITEINPAYTSQECNKCGYVDKNNRPKQEI